MTQFTDNSSCWVVTDGSAGMENQCIGLAEAMDLSPIVKRIQTKKPWRWLPPQLWINPLNQLKESADLLAPPWPDLVITCGRQAIPMSMAIRKASNGKTRTVHIQTPNTSAGNFDLVVVPEHDKLRGSNVLVSNGSLTRITEEKLQAEKEKFKAAFQDLSNPVFTVLIGGSNKCYRMTPDHMRDLSGKLQKLHEFTGAHFLITTSRRTGPDNEKILHSVLDKIPHHIWDGSGDNPYFAYLEKADAVIVTADSINMVCEAATAGKPVLIYPLEGGNRKFNYFHQKMETLGFTRELSNATELWEPPKLNETKRIADLVRERLA